jgi:hypothetical protein
MVVPGICIAAAPKEIVATDVFELVQVATPFRTAVDESA